MSAHLHLQQQQPFSSYLKNFHNESIKIFHRERILLKTHEYPLIICISAKSTATCDRSVGQFKKKFEMFFVPFVLEKK